MARIPADKRRYAFRRYEELKAERSSYMSHYQELAHYLLPRGGKFSEVTGPTPNQGGKKQMHILDNTAQRAVHVGTAGFMAGASSPARPWFKLRTPYDDLNARPSVKVWLDRVEKTMREIFNQTNTYRTFRRNYTELMVFGTAATIVLPNYEHVIWNYPQTCGEYVIDVDELGRVCTIYRKFDMTVSALVQQFGLENVSVASRNNYERGNLGVWVSVLHQIEPRRDRDPLKANAANMPWASNYYEYGGEDDHVLREGGFHEFPALVPRWEVNGSEIYGSSPGMVTLGDVKQLQLEQLRKSQGIDHMSLPALQAQAGVKVDMTPGAVTYVDMVGNGMVRNLMDVRIDLNHLLMDIQDVRMRIKQAFFEDLFLMIASDSRTQPATAREIAERHEEKLIMLGPVLESLHDEMLAPKIELTFAHMIRAGLVPPPPPELQGVELVVQFVSMLAQAQRLVGLSAVDRLLGTVGAVAQLKPEILDKIDADQVVDIYADMLGVDPTMIVADERVAIIRSQRAQMQQAAAAVEAAPAVASTARDLAQASQLTGGTVA